MQTTPEYPPEIDTHQKKQNIQKLYSERGYRISVGKCSQGGGEAAALVTKPASLHGMEIRALRQITRMRKKCNKFGVLHSCLQR